MTRRHATRARRRLLLRTGGCLLALAAALGAPPLAAAPVLQLPAAPAADAPAAAAPAGDAADAALLAAHAAYVDGDADRVALAAPAAAGSLLENYVDYWQLSARLHAAAPDDTGVRAFLARAAGTVLADRLRAEWLVVLAARGDFAGFDAERRRLVLGGDDAQLACYTHLARYAVDDGHRREAIARDARRTLAQIVRSGRRRLHGAGRSPARRRPALRLAAGCRP